MTHAPTGSWLDRQLFRLRLGCRWLLDALLLLLEIIGLRTPRPAVPHEAQLARFRLHHAAFRRLLESNDSFLRSLADFERCLAGEEDCDSSYVRDLALRMLGDGNQMVRSLNEIADGRHSALWPRYEALSAELGALFDEHHGGVDESLALDLSKLDCRDAERVGAKMANLGEIRNHLGLPTPDGFVLTAEAYRRLARDSGIAEPTHTAPVERPSQGLPNEEVSVRFAQRLRACAVPSEVQLEILAAYDRLAAREGGPVRVAVRSSALGEDEELSYAGQYETILHVGRSGLIDAWQRVAASLYSRAVTQYRTLQGVSVTTDAMPVGFISMVPAAAGGMAFSRDPAQPDRGQVVIEAARGLGLQIAEGSTIPHGIEVLLGEHKSEVRRRGLDLEQPNPQGYPDEVTEYVEQAAEESAAMLTDEEAVRLARWVRILEDHFGCPQDVEWAIDHSRRLFLLQSRPLEVAQGTLAEHHPVEGAEVLIGTGDVACPGIGSGVAVHADDDADFDTFPRGAVLVTKRPSPKFVGLMGKTAAIVADAGSTTGHMASLAREFRVPTLLGTRNATRLIPQGQLVTVDAFGGFVYLGAVDAPTIQAPPKEALARGRRTARTRLLLRRASELIVPLRLTDPQAPEFCADSCRSLHDITRYVHERSYEEMFRMGEALGDFRSAAYYLDIFLPIDLYIIDLGGGVSEAASRLRIKPSEIESIPLKALLRGMLHPKIPRWGARSLDLRGFASVIMQHALSNPEQERTFRDPSYALISDKYVNYTARVGYHFSVVDAYCGATTNKNYVHLLFRGGAADLARRSRRARAIAAILREWGFSIQVADDSTHGRIHKMPHEEALRLIENVGRLLQFMRQMDVAMAHESSVEQVKNAFLRGDYALEHLEFGGGDAAPKL